MNNIQQRLNFKPNWQTFIIHSFAVFGIGWAILEPLFAFFPSLSSTVTGWYWYIGLVIISLAIGAFQARPQNKLYFQIGNNRIEIVFGDLFKQPGIKVIPVSTFLYETEVYESSLQRIVINEITSGAELLQGLIDYEELLNQASKSQQPLVDSLRDPTRISEPQYPVGTTATIRHNRQIYLYLALTKTELKNRIPDDNCNVTQLWNALEAMWVSTKNEARGQDINIPLLGSGATGINLKSNRLLELNLLSLRDAILTNGQLTTGTIRIVLYRPKHGNINLKEYASLWEK